MAETKERFVKRKVVAILKAHDAYYFYPVTGGFGASGVPDIVVCHCGFFIGIECKAGKNTPTALQKQNIERIRNANGIALVINEENVWEVETLLGSMEKWAHQAITQAKGVVGCVGSGNTGRSF
jgi:hypothetical protein